MTPADNLEAAYNAPAADIGPTSPRAELLAAANALRHRGGYPESELALWLADTDTIHFPDETGRHCERDGDTWPCDDVHAAQKAAFAFGYTA